MKPTFPSQGDLVNKMVVGFPGAQPGLHSFSPSPFSLFLRELLMLCKESIVYSLFREHYSIPEHIARVNTTPETVEVLTGLCPARVREAEN